MQFFQELSGIFTPFLHFPFEDPVEIFLLVLLIILFTPLIFRKFKIPYIIGLIAAGMVCGPNGLNLLANDKSFDLLGKVGILYIMFLAGLDLDIREFKENKYKSVAFGAFTFALPLMIGFPVCYYLLGFKMETSLLTAAMFSTHTLVSYPIVSARNISHNKAVTTTIGGTILTDMAVLIILAFVLEQSHGAEGGDFLLKMGVSLATFLAFMFWIVPKISVWFFKKFENEKQSHFIYALSVMFLSAFISELAGLEAIIGAFLAGLALNKFIPHSSALMNRLDFIGNSLFIPFFLISVGMLVDVSILFSGWTPIMISLTLSVVAISGKWLAAALTQIVFKFSSAQRQLILGLSSSHAAATLAIILAGYKAEIISVEILNGTIILILITCVFSSIVTQHAADRILREGASENEQKKAKKTRILIPVSNPQTSQSLIETALLMKEKTTETLYALNIIDDHDATLDQIQAGQRILDQAARAAAASDNRLLTMTRYSTSVANGILHTIKEHEISDVFLGTSLERSPMIFLERISDKIEQEFSINLFMLHNKLSINMLKRIVVAIPDKAQENLGFVSCWKKLRNLALQLGAQVCVFATAETIAFLQNLSKEKSLKLSAEYEELASWEDFLMIKKTVQKGDLITVFLARKNTISYTSLLEKVPYYLSKFFEENSTMLIYPEQEKEGKFPFKK